MFSLSEDAARCLACLSFWAPSTRLRKAMPLKRYLDLSPDPPPSISRPKDKAHA